MNVIAVHGGPRKKGNTAQLLEEALKGAESKGAQTELIHLYDYQFQGCYSCFACKRKGGNSLEKCAIKDDLQPILEKIETCDALLVGSPIYFRDVTGMTRCFVERLLFPHMSYEADKKYLAKKPIPTAFVFTMNASESAMESSGYNAKFSEYARWMDGVYGTAQKQLVATETLQVPNYDDYYMSRFDAAERTKRHEEVFPEDLKRAFELGASLL